MFGFVLGIAVLVAIILVLTTFVTWENHCSNCDDTGVIRYFFDGTALYCVYCRKGDQLRKADQRRNRIAEMERRTKRGSR